MYDIISKEHLNDSVAKMIILAPRVAAKAQPGQFVILRAGEDSERLPLTIVDSDTTQGSITLIFQLVGAGTMELDCLNAGDSLHDFVGPLGRPTALSAIRHACVVGGGVGCAISYAIAKALKKQGAIVHSVIGFREKGLVIMEDDFRAVSDVIRILTDDGSYAEKGLVTDALEDLILQGNHYDEVIAIGPLIMMKYVCLVTKKYGIKTTVSMNTTMVDGTGMCGGCRLTVGGIMKFACVDGPDFDGHLVDFDEAISRGSMYREWELSARDNACNLFSHEVN